MASISLARFLKEAHRRRVFRIVGLYIFGAFVVLQVADLAFPGLGISESAIRYVWIATILGFPIAVVFSWRFDIVGGRLVHTTDLDGEADLPLNRADYLILGIYSFAAIAIVVGFGAKIMDSSLPGNDIVSPETIDASSIAVLAFDNLSPDPDNAYFAEGISEEILNVLTGVVGLKVSSRTSAFSFRGSDTPIREIARQLGVAHVLEGSVRKQATRVRITAQLIDAQTDTHLWSDTYDRELSDIFEVQEEIAQAIAVALQDVLGVRTVKVDIPTRDLEAYQLFLQGRAMFYQRGEALIGAIAALRAAVDRDPDFALAWTFLAAAAQVAPEWAGPDWAVSISEEDGDVLADEASRMALELDPNLGLALAVRARLKEGRGDLIEAFDLYHRAIIANPVESTSHLWLGLINLTHGYLSEALLYLERSYELDPLVENTNRHLGTAYLFAAQEALAEQRNAMSGQPGGQFWVHVNHLILSGDLDEAIIFLERYLFTTNKPHTLRFKDLLFEALRNGGSASVNALIAEEDEYHGAGKWHKPNVMLLLNLPEQYFEHYSHITTTTPLGDLLPVWLPGNRAFVEHPRFYAIMSGFGARALWLTHGYPDGCTLVNDPDGDHLDCAERYEKDEE